jgi:AcrR family transcriptional regulator
VPTRKPAGAAVLRPEKTEAITAAFFAELGAHGYAGLTMDRVAERAGVGKAALYRRWPSKREMLVDLVGQYATQAVMPNDTGTLRGDLLAIADEAIRVLVNPMIRSVVQSLVVEAPRTPDLAAVVANRFITPRREAGAEMLLRARRRGEIGPKADLQLAQDLFGGPRYLRGAILGEEFPPATPNSSRMQSCAHCAQSRHEQAGYLDRVGVGAAQIASQLFGRHGKQLSGVAH